MFEGFFVRNTAQNGVTVGGGGGGSVGTYETYIYIYDYQLSQDL